ncbi:orotidine-5'-phosphate decarboxylase [Candidatus Saccharibacteria bacterium]|jgi:orotidine-5'-phosphate decarboxylase|nr:orotidine-5'-phosphate decarboxylase [Candidatus Saccharibacteria bacterium]MBP9131673.1 orotidine-5'-phosphate decarboxylase [Candidatus Saccharibacteria bacterium]
MKFADKLAEAATKNNSLLCIGLDADTTKLPQDQSQFEFIKSIIDSTSDLVCAYKPNSAFYEAEGSIGIQELKDICDYLHQHYPEIPIILDAKRGDIGNTNNGYVKFAFDYLGADAITLHPYLGGESLTSFIDRPDKQLFIMGRNSNPGASEFQDLEIDQTPLYIKVIESFSKNWDYNGNISFVAGATYPDELAEIRRIVGEDKPLLIPGIGAQGGEIEATVKAGVNSTGDNAIISSSRAVIFADNPRQAALVLRDEINLYRGSNE